VDPNSWHPPCVNVLLILGVATATAVTLSPRQATSFRHVQPLWFYPLRRFSEASMGAVDCGAEEPNDGVVISESVGFLLP
jgi:hypothetical protein